MGEELSPEEEVKLAREIEKKFVEGINGALGLYLPLGERLWRLGEGPPEAGLGENKGYREVAGSILRIIDKRLQELKEDTDWEEMKKYLEEARQVIQGKSPSTPEGRIMEFLVKRARGEKVPWPEDALREVRYSPAGFTTLKLLSYALAGIDPLSRIFLESLDIAENSVLRGDVPRNLLSVRLLWPARLGGREMRNFFEILGRKAEGTSPMEPNLYAAFPHSIYTVPHLIHFLSNVGKNTGPLSDMYQRALEEFLVSWGKDLQGSGHEFIRELGQILVNLGHSGWKTPEGELFAQVVRSLWYPGPTLNQETLEKVLEGYDPERISLLRTALGVLSPLTGYASRALEEITNFEREVLRSLEVEENG